MLLLFFNSIIRDSEEDEGETSEEQRAVADGGLQMVGIATENYFDRGMMLRFEQGKELDCAKVTNLQGGIGKMKLRQLLNNLDDARAGGDRTTREVRPVDGAVGMKHDAIDCVALPFGGRGVLQDVVERV